MNPWGIAFSSSGPFWIADQGTGSLGIYNTAGIAVATPVPILTQPTGIVQNPTAEFPFSPGAPSTFIVCTATGTISAVAGSSAAVKVDRSASGAVYTGMARASYGAGSAIYVANFHAGTIEVYDGNFNSLSTSGPFQDPMIPSGFAPYNIWANGNKLYITYARQDASRTNPVISPGSGYVDIFDANGSLVQQFASGGTLNAPFGLAIAPPKFGDFPGALLVGNFGDGTIGAYNLINGRLLGTIANASGQVLVINSLRSLAVGNGASAGDANTVYFTAGSGLFGGLQGPSIISNNGIVNAAGFQLGAAPSTWVSLFGNNLASTTRSWQSSDFVNGALPRQLDGVSVSVNGIPAYISYVSPTQLNVLLPTFTGPGVLQMTAGGLAGTPVTLQFSQLSPALFQIGTSGYVSATHSDGSLIGPSGLFTSTTKPARVGEVVTIYGNGFGVTNPPAQDGVLVPQPLSLATPPSIFFGGTPAQVVYAGLVGPGLYQFNVVVPQVDSGDLAVTAQVGSVTTPSALLTVQ
jgi:uncharacterized protein (TIGR03118 family)